VDRAESSAELNYFFLCPDVAGLLIKLFQQCCWGCNPIQTQAPSFIITSQMQTFLLVEDNEDDIILMWRSFIKRRVLNPLHAVKSGKEAIEYLMGEGRYSNREEFAIPKTILLDLKMPGMDGFQVLRWIRERPEFNHIRVVVLTSSHLLQDIVRAYELGANSFLVKPADLSDILRISRAVEGYWAWTPDPGESEDRNEAAIPPARQKVG
jgi:CheY-like chemotaxis protein